MNTNDNINLSTIITVIPTFFNDSNLINSNNMLKHIKNQYINGIRTIVILGTTSENSTLKICEKINIAKKIWNKFNNKLSIIIGVGGTDTENILTEIQKLKNYCNAFLISSPYYNKPTQEGLFQHFSYIFTKIDKKFILYNIPSRTSVNIEPETILRLYNNFKNKIIGIKECCGSISQIIKLKMICPIVILSGDDELVLPLLSIGAVGVISVIANIFPTNMLEIVDLFKNGKIEDSNKKFYEIMPFIKGCFIETNPVPIKYFLKLKYNYDDNVRLPLVKLKLENKEYLENILTNKN